MGDHRQLEFACLRKDSGPFKILLLIMVVHRPAPQGINTRFRGNDSTDAFLSKLFHTLYKCKAVRRFASVLLEIAMVLPYACMCCILTSFHTKKTKNKFWKKL